MKAKRALKFLISGLMTVSLFQLSANEIKSELASTISDIEMDISEIAPELTEEELEESEYLLNRLKNFEASLKERGDVFSGSSEGTTP
jgi:hypothetical protein